MKRLAFILAILSVIVFSTAMVAGAADVELAKKSTLETILKSGEFRVGFDSGYMPFEMTTKKGKYIGFDMDIAKEMAKAMGVKFVPVNTAWDGIIPALMTNKFDIIMAGMTVTPERNLKVNFTDPYIVVGQTIVLNKKWEGKITSYKDLNDPKYIITTKLGTTGDEAVKRMIPKCTHKTMESESEAAIEVLNGKADAFIYDLPYCAIFMAQQGKGKLAFLEKPFTYEPLAFAINRGDPDFLNWLNNFLMLIKNDGRYDRLYDKWFNNDAWYEQLK